MRTGLAMIDHLAAPFCTVELPACCPARCYRAFPLLLVSQRGTANYRIHSLVAWRPRDYNGADSIPSALVLKEFGE
jgi:hypothetical protein